MKKFLRAGSLLPLAAIGQEGRETAGKLFAEYQRRAAAFDPAAADLYCDTAIIRNSRTYPDG